MIDMWRVSSGLAKYMEWYMHDCNATSKQMRQWHMFICSNSLRVSPKFCRCLKVLARHLSLAWEFIYLVYYDELWPLLGLIIVYGSLVG